MTLTEEEIKRKTVLKRNLFKEFLSGNDIVHKLFMKHYKAIMLTGILLFAYIGNRYTCEKQQAEVVALQRQLKEIKYEALTSSAELMQMSRQSNVQQLLKQKNIDLKISTTSPIHIKD